MIDYLYKYEETKAVIDSDGWFPFGDLEYIDEVYDVKAFYIKLCVI